MITFVTAIYGYGLASLFGGRGRHIHFYNTSLKNIANLGMPIVIYTDEQNAQTVEQFVSPYMKNFKIIPQPLEWFEYSKEVLDYKQSIIKHISLNDRNEILCYCKAYWVKDAIEKNYFNTDRFLWIDSGLTHHGIIPEKVGGVELFANIPPEQYYPHNPNNIFNPTLGQKLSATLKQDKLLFCSQPWQGDGSLVRRTICDYYKNESYPPITNHLIGGMFGGYKDKFLEFFNIYRNVLKFFIDKHVHVLEEPIFSAIYIAHKELFDLREFYTWYFYSPGERTHVLDREGESFYKIFTKIYEE